jgi:hypothetical protein
MVLAMLEVRHFDKAVWTEAFEYQKPVGSMTTTPR